MRMQVDEPWCNQCSISIDLSSAFARNTAHVSDRIPTDRQITCVGFVKSAVYDGAASNYNIVRHNVCLEAVETCERQTSVYRSCAKDFGRIYSCCFHEIAGYLGLTKSWKDLRVVKAVLKSEGSYESISVRTNGYSRSS